MPENCGAKKLLDTGEQQKAVADRLGVSRQVVSYWQRSEKKPGAQMREKLRAHYNIAPELWDLPWPPPAPPAAPPAAPPSPRREPDQPTVARVKLDEATDVVARLRAQLAWIDAARNGPEVTLAMSVKLCSMEQAAVQKLAQYTGEGYAISESRLVRLPVFQLMVEKLLDAIEPWPDALEAVSRILDDKK